MIKFRYVLWIFSLFLIFYQANASQFNLFYPGEYKPDRHSQFRPKITKIQWSVPFDLPKYLPSYKIIPWDNSRIINELSIFGIYSNNELKIDEKIVMIKGERPRSMMYMLEWGSEFYRNIYMVLSFDYEFNRNIINPVELFERLCKVLNGTNTWTLNSTDISHGIRDKEKDREYLDFYMWNDLGNEYFQYQRSRFIASVEYGFNKDTASINLQLSTYDWKIESLYPVKTKEEFEDDFLKGRVFVIDENEIMQRTDNLLKDKTFELEITSFSVDFFPWVREDSVELFIPSMSWSGKLGYYMNWPDGRRTHVIEDIHENSCSIAVLDHTVGYPNRYFRGYKEELLKTFNGTPPSIRESEQNFINWLNKVTIYWRTSWNYNVNPMFYQIPLFIKENTEEIVKDGVSISLLLNDCMGVATHEWKWHLLSSFRMFNTNYSGLYFVFIDPVRKIWNLGVVMFRRLIDPDSGLESYFVDFQEILLKKL